MNEWINFKSDIKRDIEVSGEDPQASWLNLGNNSGFDLIVPCNCSNSSLLTKIDCEDSGFEWSCDFYTDEETIYNYTYIDNNVIDGYEYTYSITAYDTGVMSDRVTISEDEDTGEWVADTVSVPDPNGWGEINSFETLENSKGTTEYDDNFVRAIPGYTPQTDWSEILVIPNGTQ